jgi:hypothetical protein
LDGGVEANWFGVLGTGLGFLLDFKMNHGLGWHSEYMGSSELGFQVAEYYEGACSI